MASIQGVQIPDKLRLVIGLTHIYGIGRTRARNLVEFTGLSPDKRVGALDEGELSALRSAIDAGNFAYEGDLRREVQLNLRRLQDIRSYRGIRHNNRLPVRGQRTKTNARQKRGRAQTIAGKKKVTR